MKYTKEQRLEIGREIYEGKLSRYEAAEQYGISEDSARDYMRLYRDVHHLPSKRSCSSNTITAKSAQATPSALEDLEAMSKEELINEIVRSRINEARLKKGYEVKGDGTVIRYVRKNTKS